MKDCAAGGVPLRRPVAEGGGSDCLVKDGRNMQMPNLCTNGRLPLNHDARDPRCVAEPYHA